MCAGQDRLARLPARARRGRARPYDEQLVVEGEFTANGGTTPPWRELLDRRPDVDGVFAASDLAAIGVDPGDRAERPHAWAGPDVAP